MTWLCQGDAKIYTLKPYCQALSGLESTAQATLSSIPDQYSYYPDSVATRCLQEFIWNADEGHSSHFCRVMYVYVNILLVRDHRFHISIHKSIFPITQQKDPTFFLLGLLAYGSWDTSFRFQY
ncbi:hypothetical protein NPIL_167811 [Nephila pilipes]|uniref:Uncharacterized protein n=1 Tax=Nephila pilipes TaxID=299642 RepID=A0A8X6NKI1_NEPPI|nr:hypothetical protein NPIL_167811 [Nephila pilipes]